MTPSKLAAQGMKTYEAAMGKALLLRAHGMPYKRMHEEGDKLRWLSWNLRQHPTKANAEKLIGQIAKVKKLVRSCHCKGKCGPCKKRRR